MIKKYPIFCVIASMATGCIEPMNDFSGAGGQGESAAVIGQSSQAMAGGAGVPLRYMAINVGNASPQYGCWEYKLCRPQDVIDLRNYIDSWQPDIILLSEVYRAAQLTGTAVGGPILPAGYTGLCGKSVDRHTGAAAAYNADDASHEHDCVAWKTSRLSPIAGSERSAYGRNDTWGKANCGYDFTGFRVGLMVDGVYPVTAVSAHPDAKKADCRTEEIARYWSQLATGSAVIIGGDFNSESAAEIQRRASYADNFAGGVHWNIAHHDEYTAFYIFGIKYKYDWAFSNVGAGCTSCGSYYGTADLTYGSVIGGHDGMPRADGGEGMDHRQILVDMMLAGTGGECAHDPHAPGEALGDGCNACAAAVCATDPYCCENTWDSTCVREADERCPACSHTTDTTGDALFNGCDECVSTVCAADAWCCNNAWDALCVSEAANMCL